MYKFENWTWCRCWLPLLGAIAGLPLLGIGGGGCTRWRIGRGAIAGCHYWAAIAGCHCWVWGGVGVQVGGLDVVPLLAAIAGCHCWAAIAGDRGGVGVHVGGLDVVALLAAIDGCHCWVPLLGCHCWVPLWG